VRVDDVTNADGLAPDTGMMPRIGPETPRFSQHFKSGPAFAL